jgi:hypothetical protein
MEGLGNEPGTHASAIPNCAKPSSNGQQLLILPATGIKHRKNCKMQNTIICAIVVVMLASTVAVAKPSNNKTNGQTREQYCRQLVGPEMAVTARQWPLLARTRPWGRPLFCRL